MIINNIKINNKIHTNVETEFYDEEQSKIIKNPILPTDLDAFKAIAIDTIQTDIGQRVKKEAKTQINLSASTSKYALMLYKILKENKLTMNSLTEKEKATIKISDTLIEQGYCDSDLMLNTLEKVMDYRVDGGIKIGKIMSANTIKDIISLLNEV
jgi:hypothetical protein